MRKGLQATLQQLDGYEANGGHKSPYVFPEVNGILNHEMEPSHTHHPRNDETFLEWGRNTDAKNLTQKGTASCKEEAPKIGRLVRMDVGEILQSWGSSSNERGNIHVVLGERILYEEPDGTCKKGCFKLDSYLTLRFANSFNCGSFGGSYTKNVKCVARDVLLVVYWFNN